MPFAGQKTPCAFCSGVVSAWCRLLWKSDIWPVDPLTFSKKNPSRAIPRSTYIHPPSLAEDPSKDLGGVGEQTDRQTNVARIIVWWLSGGLCSHVLNHASCKLLILERASYKAVVSTWWNCVCGSDCRRMCVMSHLLHHSLESLPTKTSGLRTWNLFINS